MSPLGEIACKLCPIWTAQVPDLSKESIILSIKELASWRTVRQNLPSYFLSRQDYANSAFGNLSW